MKKLVVAKILLISAVPFWMACGKTAVQSELTPTQNNEVKFVTKKAKSAEGVKGIEIAPAGGGGYNAPIDGPVAVAEGVKGIAAEKPIDVLLNEGVKGVIANSQLEEGVKGRFADIEEGVKGLVDGQADLAESLRAVAALDEGVKGKMDKLAEGVKGLVDQLIQLEEGVKGLVEIDPDTEARIVALEEGVKGITQLMEELEEGVKGLETDEGVKGKVALVGNILVLEGEVADQAFKQLILVVDGREKFAVDVNPETMTYAAKFELNKDDMQKMIIDVVIGNEVLTFLILEGQLQAYNF